MPTQKELSADHKERLEKAGWKVGDVADFLELNGVTEHFEEFYVSHDQWWPFYMVPLYSTHMLMAVTVGDAEVKESFYMPIRNVGTTEVSEETALENGHSSSDIYFKWVRPMKDRKRIYPPLEGPDPGELSGLPTLGLSKELQAKYDKMAEIAKERGAKRKAERAERRKQREGR